MNLTFLIVGLAAGVALTYLTVIIPRSAELDRARNSSPLIENLDLKRLLDQADPTVSWGVDISEESAALGPSGEPISRYRILSASATIPAGQQIPKAEAIKSAIASIDHRSTLGIGIRENSSTHRPESDGFLRTHIFDYIIDGHRGSIIAHLWGTGDTLRIFLAVGER
jgi:hypothetical protein